MHWTLTITLVLALAKSLNSCSLTSNFQFLSLGEILTRSSLVLLGTDIQHVTHADPEWEERTDSIFNVSCILKNTNNITVNSNITIWRISPRITCETSPPDVGSTYILAVKPYLENSATDTFEWDEVKTAHSAAREADSTTVSKVMKVCGFQNPYLPPGGMAEACPTPVDASQCEHYSSRAFMLSVNFHILILWFIVGHMHA